MGLVKNQGRASSASRSPSPGIHRSPDMDRINALYSAGKSKAERRRSPDRNVMQQNDRSYSYRKPTARRGKVYPTEGDPFLDRMSSPRQEHFVVRKSPSPSYIKEGKLKSPSPTKGSPRTPKTPRVRYQEPPGPLVQSDDDWMPPGDGAPRADSDCDEEEFALPTARSDYTGYTPRNQELARARMRKQVVLDIEEIVRVDEKMWRPLKNSADDLAYLRYGKAAWRRHRHSGASLMPSGADIPLTIQRTHLLDTRGINGAPTIVLRLKIEAKDLERDNKQFGSVYIAKMGHRGLPGLPRDDLAKSVGFGWHDEPHLRHRNPKNEVNHGYGSPDKQWEVRYETWEEECGWCENHYSLSGILKHRKRCHKRPVKCSDCPEEYAYDTYAAHMGVCVGQLDHCDLCHKEMERGSIEDHKIKSCSRRREPCPKCGDLVDISRVDEHRTGECLMTDAVCEFCNSKMLRLNLENHQMCECPTAIATCGLCGDKIKAADFSQHLAYECRERLLECAFCKDPYPVSEERAHPLSCPKVPVPCAYCMTKINREKLKQHEEIECPNRPIQCPLECGRQVKASEVAKHISLECTSRPRDCEYCFEQVLAARMQLHYEECSEFPVECKWCGASFLRKIILDHEDECEERMEECQDCGAAIQATQEAVDKHYLEECPLRVVKCEWCGGEFEAEILESTHPATCPSWPEHCEHCNKPVKAEKMAEHVGFECPDRPMKCVVCMNNVKARDHRQHVENCRKSPPPGSPASSRSGTPTGSTGGGSRANYRGTPPLGRSPSQQMAAGARGSPNRSVAGAQMGRTGARRPSPGPGQMQRSGSQQGGPGRSTPRRPSPGPSPRATGPGQMQRSGSQVSRRGTPPTGPRPSASPGQMQRSGSKSLNRSGSQAMGGGGGRRSPGGAQAQGNGSPGGMRRSGSRRGSSQSGGSLMREPSLSQMDVPGGPRDRINMRRGFDFFDTDKDGRISRKEFRERGEQMGMNADQATRAFIQVDADEDGLIDQKEFEGWWLSVDPRIKLAPTAGPANRLMKKVKISMLKSDQKKINESVSRSASMMGRDGGLGEGPRSGLPCECGARFQTPEELQAHRDACPMRVVSCNLCSFNFRAKSMPSHLKRHEMVTKVDNALKSVAPIVGIEVDYDSQIADGAEITVVERGSPAEDAGFLVGDLIFRWGGLQVRDATEYADAFRMTTKPGAAMLVEVSRGQGSHTLSLEVGAKGIPPEKTQKMKDLVSKWERDMAEWERNPPFTS